MHEFQSKKVGEWGTRPPVEKSGGDAVPPASPPYCTPGLSSLPVCRLSSRHHSLHERGLVHSRTPVFFGLVNVNFCDSFELTDTRGHYYKLSKPRCTFSLIQKFFANKVINICDALPFTENFSSLSAFRNSMEKVDFSSVPVSSISPV